MALLSRGRLFAGALFAGALFGAIGVEVVVPKASSGLHRLWTVNDRRQELRELDKQRLAETRRIERLRADDEAVIAMIIQAVTQDML